MNVLITGSTGLLGSALSRRLARSHDVTGVSRRRPAVSSAAGRHVVCDLREADAVRRLVADVRPDVVIHTQALADVDQCEREPAAAQAMNVGTTRHLHTALRGGAAWFVYISSDYVFDGRKGGPYDELDAPNPLSAYGRAKRQGEEIALGVARGLVVRPSTLFGPGRAQFCDELVERFRRSEPVDVFRDQSTSPTYTEDVAEAFEALLAVLRQRPPSSRVLHVANGGVCPRVAFAERVADALGAPRTLIRPVPMALAGRPARRPACSALTSRFLREMIGRDLRPWHDALDAYLRQRHWLN